MYLIKMQIAIHVTDEYTFDRRSLKRFVTYVCCVALWIKISVHNRNR